MNPTPAELQNAKHEQIDWEKKVESAKVLDVARLEEVTDGEVEFVQELLDAFVESSTSDVDNIIKAIGSSDTKTLKLSAHSMKGACLSMGLNRAGTLCFFIEKGAEGLLEQEVYNGLNSNVSKQLEALHENLVSAKAAIQNYMQNVSEK